jgi:hypothetical protein
MLYFRLLFGCLWSDARTKLSLTIGILQELWRGYEGEGSKWPEELLMIYGDES